MVYSPIMGAYRLNAEDVGVPDYTAALRKGFENSIKGTEAAYKPKTLAEALLAAQLQNKINAPKAEHAEEITQADLDYKRALTQQGMNPFNRLSGVAKDAYSLEILKNRLGEDSPTYQTAKNQYDLEQESRRGLNDYRKQLSDTVLQRASSSLGKLSKEEDDVMAGFEPNTNRQHEISPERQQELLGQYQLAKQKTTTDTDTRKKNLLATNIEKTKESIEPKKLVAFAGLNGAIKLKQEQAKALTKPGSESPAYRDYLDAQNKAKFMAHQVRQFYGDSIQPSVLAQIELLTNPATWKNNPDIALRLYNSFSDLVGKEMQTYRDALKNRKVYEGGANSSQVTARTYNPATGRIE